MKKLMVAVSLVALSFGAAATGNSNNNTVPVNVSGDVGALHVSQCGSVFGNCNNASMEVNLNGDVQTVYVDGKATVVKGKDGATGATGATGAAGKDGRDGIDGINGTNGRDGKDGVDGKDGTNGIDGKDGRDGVDGKDGALGIQGEKGDKGDTGAAGADGRDGIDGAAGRDGIDGKDGKDGAAGRDGVDGKDGAQGIQGERGEKGDKGDTGAAGKDGLNGTNGKDGQNGKDADMSLVNANTQAIASETEERKAGDISAQLRIDQANANIEANRQASAATNKRVAANTAAIANHEQRITSLEQQTASGFSDLKRQIDDNRKDANAGIAGVAAMANIPQVTANQDFSVGAGIGFRGDEQALAVGFSGRVTENVVTKVAVASDTQNGWTVGAGVAVGW
jgi:hypothetical protein